MLYVKQELLESGAAVAQVTVNHLVGGSNPSFPANISGRSSAWLEHSVWDGKVQGSNPCVPTKFM